MYGDKRDRGGGVALAICLVLVLVLCLGAAVLVFGLGVRIVPKTSAWPGTAAAARTGINADRTGIYSLAAGQTIVVEARTPSEPDAFHAYGAGFFITADGYIMTNCHVVSEPLENGFPVQVRTFDDQTFPAEIVGADQDSDIALLKVQGTGFEAASLGDSDLLVPCQQVYIMGHPAEELSFTMTGGIISALGRTIPFSDGTTLDMFQLDAAVNFGNSGGPVYDSQGQVIGITTAKYAPYTSEGLGFAIPINTALRIARDLRDHGYVRGRPLMGITVRNLFEEDLEEKGCPEGVLVYQVTPGLSGDRAGLQSGDVILSLAGTRVTSTNDLVSAKKPYLAGDTVTLEIWRDGETFETEMTFDEVDLEHPTGSVPIDELEDPEEPEEEPAEEPED